jgi:hypothetical protein
VKGPGEETAALVEDDGHFERDLVGFKGRQLWVGHFGKDGDADNGARLVPIHPALRLRRLLLLKKKDVTKM